MPSSKCISFSLVLIAASLLSACGSNSSSSSAPAPATVDQSAFEGDPGKFSALYTGTCVIQTADRSYTNCSTRVRVEQTPYLLFVRTQFFLNPSSKIGNSVKLVGRTEDTYVINGKVLSLGAGKPQIGTIGQNGFFAIRGGQPYRFVRLYPNNYEYSGTFADDSGRSVVVTGRVQRGSTIVDSSHRTK